MKFAYDIPNHAYYLDSQIVPGVTELINPLNNYANVPAFILEQAAERGRIIHQACAAHINGDFFKVASDLDGYIQAFRGWWADTGFDMCARKTPVSERPMAHCRLKYAGTPDLIIDGMAIVDIKTRKYNKCTDPLQLVAYENLWINNGGMRTQYKHIVLELHKDGIYKPIIVNHQQAWSKFRFLLNHWHCCREYESNIEKWKKA